MVTLLTLARGDRGAALCPDLIDVRDVLWSLLQLARAKWRRSTVEPVVTAVLITEALPLKVLEDAIPSSGIPHVTICVLC